MFTGRRCGGTGTISLPSSRMRPSVGASNPASIRNKRGLAAARRAKQREKFAMLDIERKRLHRYDRAEPLGDGLKAHQRRLFDRCRFLRCLAAVRHRIPVSQELR